MSMKRFFAEKITDRTALLSSGELHHCLHVLRVQDGEQIEVTDGKGSLWTASVKILSGKSVEIHISEQIHNDIPNEALCSLAVALTKNSERIEWLVEKATEIGLQNFYPLITSRTERHKIRTDRLEKIVISATKQSNRLWKPVIHDPVEISDFLQNAAFEQKLIAHCVETGTRKFLSEIIPNGLPSLILIGPEGDFTENEISCALQNGFQSISLSNYRLRVETAALVACAWMNTRRTN